MNNSPDGFLRDYIAAKVLAGLVARIAEYDFHGFDWPTLSRVAYKAADAMMKARNQ